MNKGNGRKRADIELYFQRGNQKNDLDSYGGSKTTTTASVLVHYSGGDTCPSQHDVKERIRAHYKDDFGAEHVELPAVR